MDRISGQSNDSLDNLRPAPPTGPDADAHRTVNQRFIAYLEQVYAPRNPRRLSALTLAVIVGAGVAAVLALALVRELHSVWPLLPLTVALIARVALGLHHRLATRHRLHRVRDVIETGIPLTGYLVQAPPALFRPGMDNLPCLVLFSFQPEVGADAPYMRHLATRLYNCKNRNPLSSEGRYLAGLTSDDVSVLYRRRLLPFSLTDGSTVYCADVWVSRAYIRDGYLSGDTLPLLAQPGDSGGVELVPWWLTDANFLTETPATPGVHA